MFLSVIFKQTLLSFLSFDNINKKSPQWWTFLRSDKLHNFHNFDFRYIPFNMDGKYNKAFEGSLTDTTDTKNVSVDLVLQGVPTSFGWKASSKIIILIFFVKIIRQIGVRSALLNQNINKI